MKHYLRLESIVSSISDFWCKTCKVSCVAREKLCIFPWEFSSSIFSLKWHTLQQKTQTLLFPAQIYNVFSVTCDGHSWCWKQTVNMH